MPVAQTRFELLHLSVNRLLSAVQSTKIPNLWDSVGCEKVVNLFILKSKTLHQVKRLSLFLIFLLSSFSALAQQSILGRWNTGQENTVLEVKEVQGKIEGRIVASDHTKAPPRQTYPQRCNQGERGHRQGELIQFEKRQMV
uniref:hypothetical protein n=1 Tax=Algoriphagus sp. TaxID=1872435 RepID=UPI004047654B